MDEQNVSTQEATPVATPTETTSAAPVESSAVATPTETSQETEDTSYLLPLEEEAQATETPAAQGLEQYLGISQYVNSPEMLQAAVADAHLINEIINGQQPPSALIDGLKNVNPQAWQSIVIGLAQYFEQETGYKFVDPNSLPQQENADPVQQKLSALEKQLQDQNRQRTEQAQQYRAQQASSKMLGHLTTALKGTFLEGDEANVLQQVGAKLGADTDKVIAAIEKGDMKTIDAALKAVKREETERYNRYAKRIAAQRKATANSLPKVDNPGQVAKTKDGQFDLSTREGRIAAMNAAV